MHKKFEVKIRRATPDDLARMEESRRQELTSPPAVLSPYWAAFLKDVEEERDAIRRSPLTTMEGLISELAMHRATLKDPARPELRELAALLVAPGSTGDLLRNASERGLPDATLQRLAELLDRTSAEARKNNSKKAAKKKHATNAQARAKADVGEQWRRWTTQKPHLYRGPTDFADDMLVRHSNVLKSHETIMKWCREWKKEAQEKATVRAE